MRTGSQAHPVLRRFVSLQSRVYRLTGGRIGGRTLGMPTMLLTTLGARSGLPRTTPLIFLPDDEGWAIFATDNASDRNPAWYHNLRAHPEAEMQIGRDRFRVRATLAPEAKRRELWEQGKRVVKRFPLYEQRTGRAAIPVFRLRRIDGRAERGADDAQHVEAIRALIHRYAERLDDGDLEGFAALFTAGVLCVEGTSSEARGAAEVRAMMAKSLRLYDGVPATRHVNSNTLVTVAADAASAEACGYFTVFQALPDFPLQAIVVGRYRDRFRRDAEGWHFERRAITMDLVGDVSRHLAGTL